MRLRWLIIVSFLLCSFYAMGQADSLSTYPFPKTWEEAVKISAETFKPILYHRTNASEKSNELKKALQVEIFSNQQIMDSLSNHFVVFVEEMELWGYEKQDRFLSYRFPTTTISDFEKNIFCQFQKYKNGKEFLEKLGNCMKRKPIFQYYEEYPDSLDNKDFIDKFTGVLIDQGIRDRGVYEAYIDLFPEVSDRSFEVLTNGLYQAEYDELFKSLYFDFRKAGYDEERLLRRLINVMYREANVKLFKRNYQSLSREEIIYKYSDKAFSGVQKFLGESDDFKDSLMVFSDYSYAKNRATWEPNEENLKRLFAKTLPLHYYDMISVYGEKKSFEMTFDLFMSIEDEESMDELIYILKNSDFYKDKYQYVEILAMCYYRMDNEKKAAKLLGKANTLAVEKGIKFRPVLPQLKANGNIGKIERTSRKK